MQVLPSMNSGCICFRVYYNLRLSEMGYDCGADSSFQKKTYGLLGTHVGLERDEFEYGRAESVFETRSKFTR